MYRSSIQMMTPRTTPCVKILIIVNLVCWFFLVSIIQRVFMKTDTIYHLFGFVPSAVIDSFFIWQFFTYMFLHGSGMFHILFNMMVLWMFGSELEQLWKKKFFLTYYLVCGVGSSLVYFIGVTLYSVFGGHSAVMDIPVVGASGAVFGLLLAYGLIFGDRLVLFMFVFPMKARTFTILIAAVELFTMLNSGFGSPVANLAHLGGLLSGFLFLNLRSVLQRLHARSLLKKRSSFKVLKEDDEQKEPDSSSPKYWN
jgi:membrane associated rhomboid family serine protease